MSKQQEFLKQFEEIVLLAVKCLEGEAYGSTIRQKVSWAQERDVGVGAIYATLDRLERKGYIRSWEGEGTKERGGRRKRHFQVEKAGLQALIYMRRVRSNLTAGLNLDSAGLLSY